MQKLWTVKFTKKALKQLHQLPENIQKKMYTLAVEIESRGPVQGSWPNYSKLTGNRHHCHLSYSFVAVWIVIDHHVHMVEVIYVGSRKDAPY